MMTLQRREVCNCCTFETAAKLSKEDWAVTNLGDERDESIVVADKQQLYSKVSEVSRVLFSEKKANPEDDGHFQLLQVISFGQSTKFVRLLVQPEWHVSGFHYIPDVRCYILVCVNWMRRPSSDLLARDICQKSIASYLLSQYHQYPSK